MRKILITGANKGIGLASTRAILEHDPDCFVYLGSRDAERGEAARASLGELAARVQVLPIDVSDANSVAQAAGSVEGPLYGIVNNAGVAGLANETVLEVNVDGPRRVCEAFLGHLQEGGRVVNVSSASGPSFVATCSPSRQKELTNPEIELTEWETLFAEYRESGTDNAYGLSKALLNAYTLFLARTQPGLHVNACTPGFIETDLTRPFAEARGSTPEAMGMKQPTEGTRSTLHLLFGDVPSGWYFGSDAERSPLDRSRSPGDPPYVE